MKRINARSAKDQSNQHYVSYHNADRMGYSYEHADRFSVGTKKPIDNLRGQRVWTIAGVGTPRSYFLRATWLVDEIVRSEQAEFKFCAIGATGHVFDSQSAPNGILLDELPWFRSFLKSQGNFSFGLSPIKDEFVGELDALLEKHIQTAPPPGNAIESSPTPGTSAANRLFELAVYVNVSPDRLRRADRGPNPSAPITEKKRWVDGRKRFAEASAKNEDLPLIFARYAELDFWAVASEITLQPTMTKYRFVDLRALPKGRFRRSDLVVDKTGKRLSDNFIRSYAIVRTPQFIAPGDPSPLNDTVSLAEELIGLEGEALLRMVKHRRREAKLRDAKIERALTENDGRLICEAAGCGFDFFHVYGELGKGYAQVHHNVPLSERDGPETTRLDDLSIVCANCHVMIHRGGKCRNLDEVVVLRR